MKYIFLVFSLFIALLSMSDVIQAQNRVAPSQGIPAVTRPSANAEKICPGLLEKRLNQVVRLKTYNPETGEKGFRDFPKGYVQLLSLLTMLTDDKAYRQNFFGSIEEKSRVSVSASIKSLYKDITGNEILGDLDDPQADIVIVTPDGGSYAGSCGNCGTGWQKTDRPTQCLACELMP